MSKRITILAVTARHIKTDVEGNQYIENDTEVATRMDATASVAFALDCAKARCPNALSFEIYEADTDADEVSRL